MMFFVDQEHEKEFKTFVRRYDKSGDKEYLAAYYVLTANDELRRKAARYIKPDGIGWPRIWEQDWSSGYRLILQLGESLFQSSGEVEFAYGLRTWDDELFQVAIEAVMLRRKGFLRLPKTMLA